MAFLLAKVDEDALKQVDIRIAGVDSEAPFSGESSSGIRLDSSNLQFPPRITKDSKSAEWMEVPSGSFEPMKFYVQSKSRAIGLQFEWVCGGNFPPDKVHRIVSAMKSYFYGPYFASSKDKQNYPAVFIHSFYGIIQYKTSWRMMDLSVKYSDEMCKINNVFYPLHVTVNVSLESATRLGQTGTERSSESDEESPFQNFSNLNRTVNFEWF